jgi:hypothetical protein
MSSQIGTMSPLGKGPFRRSTGRCASTGRELPSGAAYVACLVEGDAGALERVDVSQEAWDAGYRPQRRTFGNWRATYRPDAPARQALMSDDELLDLFEGLGEPTEAKQRSFRFVLALLLVRRRVMKVVGSRDRSLVLLPKRASENQAEFVVPDPGMDDRAIADAIEQLSDVLAGDGEVPAGAASDA